VATLTLLLPERSRVAQSPILTHWLSRGDRSPTAAPGRDAQLRECFEFIGPALPSAALTRSLDASDAVGAAWLRADPAYAIADAVTARLMAFGGGVGLAEVESVELARALRPLFGDAGFPLEVSNPKRWYLRCPETARLPQFSPPESVLGDDLMQHLPRGDNERQWRHLFNEAQVILHNHPINTRRVARGLLPANSLWFWGAGKLPEWVRAPYTRVASMDEVTIALAKLAKIPVVEPRAAVAELAAEESVLIDATAVPDLARARFKMIELLFASGERVHYRPWHRLRIWRSAPA
jgi:hypothetical protein